MIQALSEIHSRNDPGSISKALELCAPVGISAALCAYECVGTVICIASELPLEPCGLQPGMVSHTCNART